MKKYRTKLAQQFDKAFPLREAKFRVLIHAQYRENHTLKPVCQAQGESSTMSDNRKIINCPKCLEAIDKECVWCGGRGMYEEYGDMVSCGQCDRTGYSHPDYHQRKN